MNTMAIQSPRWSRPGVPHKGWVCLDVQDHEEPVFACEMCERTDIRYVHVMKHDEYPSLVRVGCVCAGHMEGNYAVAKDRERPIRNRAKRRTKLVERYKSARLFWSLPHICWGRSQNGSYCRTVQCKRLTIYGKANGWKWVYGDQFDKEVYPTPEEAMGGFFDRMFPLDPLLAWFNKNPASQIKLPGDKGF